MRRIWHRALSGVLLTGALVACSSDQLTIPNYNNPTVDGVGRDPSGLQLLATGLLAVDRNGLAGHVRDVSIFGREGYNYFTTDGRNITNYLEGIPGPQRLDPGGFASGGWNNRYQNQLYAVKLIEAAETSPITAAQKAAAQGFAKTLRALQLYYVIATRDSLGAITQIVEDPSTPAPIVSRDSVYRFISGLLDEAKTNLAAGGAAFSFTLHAGYAGFNTPATFLRFNRGLAARILVIRGSQGCGAPCYTQALAALSESFVTPVGAAASLAGLNVGVYQVYSTAPGDVQNANSFAVNNFVFAHASTATQAQKKADGVTLDDRVTRKLIKLAAPSPAPGNLNIPAEYRFNLYPNPDSRAGIIRNEELILLRAEANLATGNAALALQDINNIRDVSGGLPALAALPATPLDAIMYERRMSLLFEGFRWIDMRRWGRLGQLPLDRTNHFVARVMPFPLTECDARNANRPAQGCS